MRRLRFAKIDVSVVLFLLLVVAWPARGGQEESPPNILFFLTDDQRADSLGCAGHPVLQTPNIDQLAVRGVMFRNAFVTTSICAASRASILTGLHERTHGYTFGTPPIRRRHVEESYPALLRGAGYRTGFIGKFGVAVAEGGREEMFDFFRPVSRNPYFKTMPDGSKRHETELAGDHAIEFLWQGDSSKPFCLLISFNATHAEDNDKVNHFPWPKAVDGMYEDVEIAPPRLGDATIFESQPEFLKESLNRERWYWRWDTPEKYDRNMRAYYRMTSGVDRVVGRIVAELAALNLADNTIVIYTADNGYYRGDRGFAGKWSHYEESLRVPLIVSDPRHPEEHGTVVDAMALNIDLPATMADFAGLAGPDGYQGASLRPWLNGRRPSSWRGDFFCEHLMEADTRIPKYEGVRGERYFYARYFEQSPPYEFLHDLRKDPDELVNLAGDDASSAVLNRMRARCDELRDAYGGEYRPRAKD